MNEQAQSFSIIYPKDIERLMSVSSTTAKKIHNDIKSEYNLKRYVLLKHFKDYFKV